MGEVVAALDEAIARRGHDRRRLTRVVSGVVIVAAVLLSAGDGTCGTPDVRRSASTKKDSRRSRQAASETRAASSSPPATRTRDSRGVHESRSARAARHGPVVGRCDPRAIAPRHSATSTSSSTTTPRRSVARAISPAPKRRSAARENLARGRPLELAALNELTLVLTDRGTSRRGARHRRAAATASADTAERAILLKSIGLAELADGKARPQRERSGRQSPDRFRSDSRVDAFVGLGHALDRTGRSRRRRRGLRRGDRLRGRRASARRSHERFDARQFAIDSPKGLGGSRMPASRLVCASAVAMVSLATGITPSRASAVTDPPASSSASRDT